MGYPDTVHGDYRREWDAELAADTRGKLGTFEEAERFALAGNATLTIVSMRTQVRFTYKVQRPQDFKPHDPIWFVKALTGPDNEADYKYLGEIHLPRGLRPLPFNPGARPRDDGLCYRFRHGRKSPISRTAPIANAFNWAWHQIVTHDGYLHERNIEVWHEGRCGRCARKLTVPESIASGFGPECIQYVGG